MPKKISCGVVITDGKVILMGRITNQNIYDLPKGTKDENELPIDCAVRECFEETSIKINPNTLGYLGEFKYNDEKDLILFQYFIEDLPELSKIKCISYFVDKNGKQVLELVNFKYVLVEELESHCSKNLFKVLKEIIKEK